MAQLTLRVPDDLAAELKAAAARRGQSVNAWVTDVLQAAVNPDLAGDEAARTRERLRRAGLLADLPARSVSPPDPEAVARARVEAGRGRPLSELLSEGRG
ncbi:MAG: toxin-antitoxin system HicB family antitoxin [Acidimicrobiia bacterium]